MAIYLVDKQIDFLQKQILLQKQSDISPAKIRWTGGKMELVELVYALHEANCFDNATLKSVFTVFGEVFCCPIANYSRLFWDIRNRAADNRASFLQKLQKTLLEKLSRMDN